MPCAAASGEIDVPASVNVPCAVPWAEPFAAAKTTKSEEPFGVAAGAVIRIVTVVVPCASTKTLRGKSTHDAGTPDVDSVKKRNRFVGFVNVTEYVAGSPGATVGDTGLIATAFRPTTEVGGSVNDPGVPPRTNDTSVPVVTSRDSPGVRPEMSVCQVRVDEVVPKASGRVQTSVSKPAPVMISSGGTLNEFART